MNLTFITKEWLERHGDIPACSGCGVMAGPHFQSCPYIEETSMHYKNGREAKNGDKIVVFPSYGNPMIGVLYDAVAGNDYCNGRIALTSISDPTTNLKECLHLDDVKAVISESVPDSSVPKSAMGAVGGG